MAALKTILTAVFAFVLSFFRLSASQSLRYLSYYYALLNRRKKHKSRFDLYKPNLSSDVREAGILAQQTEWQLEDPSNVSLRIYWIQF